MEDAIFLIFGYMRMDLGPIDYMHCEMNTQVRRIIYNPQANTHMPEI